MEKKHIAIWPADGISGYDMDQQGYEGEWIVSIEEGFGSFTKGVFATRKEARKKARELASKLGLFVEDHG